MDAVLAELSAPALREWEAYWHLEPFGEPWAQTALLASLLANANRDPEKHPDPFQMEDFLPVSMETAEVSLEDEEPAPEPEPQWMAWKRAFQMMADATRPSPPSG